MISMLRYYNNSLRAECEVVEITVSRAREKMWANRLVLAARKGLFVTKGKTNLSRRWMYLYYIVLRIGFGD